MPVLVLALASACGSESTEQVTTASAPDVPVVQVFSASDKASEPVISKAEPAMVSYRTAVAGTGMIPYPMYPNATKYRIGGESGLRIVAFETTDSFENVDTFFRQTVATALARLPAMEDYVRYASEKEDQDPWGTHRPGIVIHHFASANEAIRYGAASDARTNIIMSYR